MPQRLWIRSEVQSWCGTGFSQGTTGPICSSWWPDERLRRRHRQRCLEASPVHKAHTSGSLKPKLRICGDYSVGINDQLEDHRHPLQLPEELMQKLGGGLATSKLTWQMPTTSPAGTRMSTQTSPQHPPLGSPAATTSFRNQVSTWLLSGDHGEPDQFSRTTCLSAVKMPTTTWATWNACSHVWTTKDSIVDVVSASSHNPVWDILDTPCRLKGSPKDRRSRQFWRCHLLRTSQAWSLSWAQNSSTGSSSLTWPAWQRRQHPGSGKMRNRQHLNSWRMYCPRIKF